MKKFCAAVIVFTVAIVVTAIWYSPLIRIGTAKVYDNNAIDYIADGVCYSADAVTRVEINGDESELNEALKKIDATVVYTAEAGDRIIVYAYSPRVAHKTFTASGGGQYNIMAAYGGGKVIIGAPILQGSY